MEKQLPFTGILSNKAYENPGTSLDHIVTLLCKCPPPQVTYTI